jgi:hypothetical protein
MNIFEKKDLQEQVERDIRRAEFNNKKIQRDFKKAQSSGIVSSFLKQQAASNEAIRSALATIDTSASSAQQPQVQYQTPISATQARSIEQRLQQSQPSPESILPPRPNDSDTYFLAVENTELSWKESSFPNGTNLGDILYWDPSGGESGEWVILTPPSGEQLSVLGSNGGAPYWIPTESCEE